MTNDITEDADEIRAGQGSQLHRPIKWREVALIIVYKAKRTSRTGRSYPVGTHIRAEIRDNETDELIAKHASSPFSTQRLRWDSEQRGEEIVRRRWTVETPKTAEQGAKAIMS